jgi:hypothetical protein
MGFSPKGQLTSPADVFTSKEIRRHVPISGLFGM